MKAGIIAAGEGSRLRSEGIDLPKPLVPVDGVPLIERLLRFFVKADIEEVACIVNEQSLSVKEYVLGLHLPIPVRFVVKSTPSSMHSLFELAPNFTEGRFLLSTVDPIFDEGEFRRFVDAGRKGEEWDGLLAVTQFIDDEHPLFVELEGSSRIRGFSTSGRTPWVTGGLYMFSPRIFREAEAVKKKGIERLRNFLAHLVAQGYRLDAFPFSKIVDVDHVRDIQTAEEMIRTR